MQVRRKENIFSMQSKHIQIFPEFSMIFHDFSSDFMRCSFSSRCEWTRRGPVCLWLGMARSQRRRRRQDTPKAWQRGWRHDKQRPRRTLKPRCVPSQQLPCSSALIWWTILLYWMKIQNYELIKELFLLDTVSTYRKSWTGEQKNTNTRKRSWLLRCFEQIPHGAQRQRSFWSIA